MAFEEVCPDRIDLIHKNYRKLCNLLIDVEEWGQVVIINMLTRYARTQFLNPNINVSIVCVCLRKTYPLFSLFSLGTVSFISFLLFLFLLLPRVPSQFAAGNSFLLLTTKWCYNHRISHYGVKLHLLIRKIYFFFCLFYLHFKVQMSQQPYAMLRTVPLRHLVVISRTSVTYH